MFKKIKQILQFSAPTLGNLHPATATVTDVNRQSKINSLSKALFYNIVSVCLFVFKEEIKKVIGYLDSPIIFDWIIDMVVDISTTMLVVHTVGSIIESLLKSRQSTK